MTTPRLQSDLSSDELYQEAPCGHLSLLPDGTIIRVNRTFLAWSGYSLQELLSGRRFSSILTVPGALLYETHCAPLLRLRHSIGEIALDILCKAGTPLPVLLSAAARCDEAGAPIVFQIVILNAPKRREYERELLRARTQAEDAAEQLRIHREIAERKVAEQDTLLAAVARMAAGDLDTHVAIEESSWLAPLADGLERMRRDILRQMKELSERNAEVELLNRELRYQIERRSGLLVESMLSKIDSGPVEATPILPPGTMLAGRYRIGAMLGQGAMGTVYQVERVWDGRVFAAKVLSVKPDYQAMARFAREAQLLARLQHPNLIAIIDADVSQDRVAFIVMELVSGASLAEFAERYGDCGFMLNVLVQIASALSVVHAADVVHRDVKPGNVLVVVNSASGLPESKLVDFGVSRLMVGAPSIPERGPGQAIDAERLQGAFRDSGSAPTANAELPDSFSPTTWAPDRAATPPVVQDAQRNDTPRPAARHRSSSDQLTQVGSILGTLRYMAPELLGGANLANPPSDIFSFGVMAYEVLTGKLPFDELPLLISQPGEKNELGAKSIGCLCAGLSPALVRVLDDCLAGDPSRRPRADELARAITDELQLQASA